MADLEVLLYDDACLAVVLPELRRAASFFLFKNAVEIAEIVETAPETDLRDAS